MQTERKLFIFDTETTGTREHHEITQLSYIIRIDGRVTCERDLLMRPLHPENADPESLTVQGRTLEQLAMYQHPFTAYQQMVADFAICVDKYDRDDKLIPVAFNAPFDVGFLSRFFEAIPDKWLGSWIDRKRTLDPLGLARWYDYLGWLHLENYQQATVCKAFGIDTGTQHNALHDVRALAQLLDSFEALEKTRFMEVRVNGTVTEHLHPDYDPLRNYRSFPTGRSVPDAQAIAGLGGSDQCGIQ
jgi:DNA polymerase III epsilon subunit-like protein